MAEHILIPVALDHVDLVPAKIAVARKLLAEGGKITLLTVLESIPGFVAEFVTVKEENHITHHVRSRLEAVRAGAGDIVTDIASGKPGIVISEYAGDNAVDLIIVGAHTPGAAEYLLGSTAQRVARRAPCSVYILREP